MQARIRHLFGASLENRMVAANLLPEKIVTAASRLVNCLLANGKIILCGQGGSAANTLHFSSILLNHFELERPALPVIALTTDSAVITMLGQEGYAESLFSRQIQALGQAEDVLVILTTSGQPSSLIHAVHAAHDRGMDVIVLSGRDGGVLTTHLGPEDIEIRVPGETSALIRETHLFVLYGLCDLIEQSLFGEVAGGS